MIDYRGVTFYGIKLMDPSELGNMAKAKAYASDLLRAIAIAVVSNVYSANLVPLLVGGERRDSERHRLPKRVLPRRVELPGALIEMVSEQLQDERPQEAGEQGKALDCFSIMASIIISMLHAKLYSPDIELEEVLGPGDWDKIALAYAALDDAVVEWEMSVYELLQPDTRGQNKYN